MKSSMRPVAPRAKAGKGYSEYRNTPIEQHNVKHFYNWIEAFIGISLAKHSVCPGHVSPLEAYSDLYFNHHALALILGPRGSGKSMMDAFIAHMRARFNRRYRVSILGGSQRQAEQVFGAIEDHVIGGRPRLENDADTIKKPTQTRIRYKNQSDIRIHASSTRSARGPHIPLVILDELDEMARSVFASAVGMAQEDVDSGYPTEILMSSTWHNDTGLMGEQIQHAKNNKIPFHTFCVFEVLQRCPDEVSGPQLEHCPACPIVNWCHLGFGEPIQKPRAKASNGHYSLETLFQKALVLSDSEMEADYWCTGPKVEGRWFRSFSKANHAPGPPSTRGEYVEGHPVYLAIDYGYICGAVAFQIRKAHTKHGFLPELHIFWDYYNDGASSYEHAINIKKGFAAVTRGLDINGDRVRMRTDPAGNTKEPGIGTAGISEYIKAGLLNLGYWPPMQGRKHNALELIRSFIKDGSGEPRLFVNARCKATIDAFYNYSRKKSGEIWLPIPADPQHPYEEPIDGLAGMLLDIYPNGREIPAQFSGPRVHPAYVT